MAYLTWIASELGSATGFPKGTSYRKSLSGRRTRLGPAATLHAATLPNWPTPRLSATITLDYIRIARDSLRVAGHKLI